LVFVIPIIGFFGTVQLSPLIMQRDFSILAVLSLVFILLATALSKLKFRRGFYMTAGFILVAGYILYIATLSGVI
jgi:cation:H+ antiporter